MRKGFDTDRSFMLVEIAGDQLYFRRSGFLEKRSTPPR